MVADTIAPTFACDIEKLENQNTHVRPAYISSGPVLWDPEIRPSRLDTRPTEANDNIQQQYPASPSRAHRLTLRPYRSRTR